MPDPATKSRHPQAAGLHALPGEAVLVRVLDAQAAALAAIRPALPAIARAAEAAAQALGAGHRVAYVGAGSSGLMALADALELPGTFGIPPDRTPVLFAGGTASLLHMQGAVEDDLSLAATDFDRAALGPGDLALCLSASGSTPYTLAVARHMQAAGGRVAGLANVPDSPLLRLADIAICLDTGAEIIGGSTRLGAATAQKAALNALSVLLGIRLGHVHDGHMVNLVADNAKLTDRAARIVAAIAACDPPTARAALAQTAGAVKPAVLVATGATPDAAHAMLTASGGHLGPALAQIRGTRPHHFQRETTT